MARPLPASAGGKVMSDRGDNLSAMDTIRPSAERSKWLREKNDQCFGIKGFRQGHQTLATLTLASLALAPLLILASENA